MNIYREVVKYVNSHNPGQTFRTSDFTRHMASLGYKDTHQPHYRINTYKTYLKSAGFLTNTKRGEWRVEYQIPAWVSLSMLETARGYGPGLNKVVQREAQDKIATYFAEQRGKVKTWEIGDQFIVNRNRKYVYTIERSPDSANQLLITWLDISGEKQSISYDIEDVDRFVSDGSWSIIKKTNIQEKALPVQINSLDLQKTQTMANTHQVSVQFITEGHKLACSAWKEKVEAKFPEIFAPQNLSVKVGETYRFAKTGCEITDYLLARIAPDELTLIQLKSGNRWSSPVKVENDYKITLAEAKTLFCGVDITTVKNASGQPITICDPDLKWVDVDEDFIRRAHMAADGDLKQKIKDNFPTIWPINKYVPLVKSVESDREVNNTIKISTNSGELAEGVLIAVTNGLAPSDREDLRGHSLAVWGHNVDCVEVIQKGGTWFIAIKQK